MKTIKYLLSVAFILINVTAITQIINLNPDQNGDPWIAGDLPEVTCCG